MRIFKNRHEEVRSGWALAGGCLAALVLVFGLGTLVGLLLAPHYATMLNKPIGYVVLELTTYAVQEGAMVGAACLMFRVFTKRPVGELGFTDSHVLSHVLWGLLGGLAPMLLVFCTLLLTGQAQVLALNTSVFTSSNWWTRLVVYAMVGLGEEALCRGYMMTALKPSRAPWLILALPSLLFSLLHLANPGVGPLPLLNIFLAGIYFAVMFIRTGSLWAPIAAHFAWNWVQGPVLGMNVSGMDNLSLLECAFPPGGELWHGGSFGAEGGLITTLVLLAATALCAFVFKPNPHPPWTLTSGLPFVRKAVPFGHKT